MIEELTLHGFICFKDLKIRFADKNLIVGKNGSGKSAIIDAILFALYGRSNREVMNKESKDTRVILTFNYNDHRYKVIRSKQNSMESFEVFKDDQIVNDPKREITSLFGSFNDFLRSCIIREGYQDFVGCDLYDLLKTVFGLEVYDIYLEDIESKMRIYEEEVRGLTNELINIISNITFEMLRGREKYINDISKPLKILNDELRAREDRLNKLMIYEKEYDDLRKYYIEYIRLGKRFSTITEKLLRYELINGRIELIKSIIDKKKELYKQLSNLLLDMRSKRDQGLKSMREEMFRLDAKKRELEDKRYRLECDISVLEERLKSIEVINKDNKCPLCNQTVQASNNLLEEYKNIEQNIESKKKELTNLISEFREVYSKLSALEIDIIKDSTELEVTITNIEERLNDIKREIDNLNEMLSNEKKELSSTKFNKNSYERIKKRYYEILNNRDMLERYIQFTIYKNEKNYLKQDVEVLKDVINKLSESIEMLRKGLASNKIDIKSIENTLGSIKELSTKIERITKDLEALNYLHRFLEESIRSVVINIFNSIKVYIDELGSKLDVKIYNKNGRLYVNDLPIESLSKGERALTYLLLRVALMLSLNTKLIVIDNVDSIDEDKLRKLVYALDVELIVTSSREFKEVFTNIITLQ